MQKRWLNHWGDNATVERLKYINNAYPEVVEEILKLTDEKSKCIEFGCGSGTYAVELFAKKRNFIASDFSETALALTREKAKNLYGIEIPTQIVDIYDIPYNDNYFDLVFSDGVIEHLDMDEVLKEMKRVIKPNGIMTAKVPSNSLFYKLAFYVLSPIENREYEVWWSKRQWKKVVEEAGYKDVKISRCGSIFTGIGMRIKSLKFLSVLDRFGRIYFLIEAQKHD